MGVTKRYRNGLLISNEAINRCDHFSAENCNKSAAFIDVATVRIPEVLLQVWFDKDTPLAHFENSSSRKASPYCH